MLLGQVKIGWGGRLHKRLLFVYDHVIGRIV